MSVRYGQGNVRALQDVLIKNRESLGLSRDLTQHSGADDKLGVNTSFTLEELLILAQKSAGVTDISRKYSDANSAHVKTYLEKQGVDADSVTSFMTALAALRRPDPAFNNVSVFDQSYVRGQVDIAAVTLPDRTPPSVEPPQTTQAAPEEEVPEVVVTAVRDTGPGFEVKDERILTQVDIDNLGSVHPRSGQRTLSPEDKAIKAAYDSFVAERRTEAGYDGLTEEERATFDSDLTYTKVKLSIGSGPHGEILTHLTADGLEGEDFSERTAKKLHGGYVLDYEYVHGKSGGFEIEAPGLWDTDAEVRLAEQALVQAWKTDREGVINRIAESLGEQMLRRDSLSRDIDYINGLGHFHEAPGNLKTEGDSEASLVLHEATLLAMERIGKSDEKYAALATSATAAHGTFVAINKNESGDWIARSELDKVGLHETYVLDFDSGAMEIEAPGMWDTDDDIKASEQAFLKAWAKDKDGVVARMAEELKGEIVHTRGNMSISGLGTSLAQAPGLVKAGDGSPLNLALQEATLLAMKSIGESETRYAALATSAQEAHLAFIEEHRGETSASFAKVNSGAPADLAVEEPVVAPAPAPRGPGPGGV